MVRTKSHFHKQENKYKNMFDKSITLSEEFIKRTRRKINTPANKKLVGMFIFYIKFHLKVVVEI